MDLQKNIVKAVVFIIVVVFFTLFLSITSCKTVKKTEISHTSTLQKTDSTQQIRHDSIFIEHTQIIKDTLFITRPDSALILALIECDKKGRAHIVEKTTRQGRSITQSLDIKDNVITAAATIDSATIYFQYKEDHYKEFKQETTHTQADHTLTTTQTDKTNVEIKKTRLPWWFWLAASGVAIFLLIRFVWPIVMKWLL